MHTEAVKTRVLHMTPVREDAQLHVSIHRVTGVLQEEEERKRNIRRKRKKMWKTLQESQRLFAFSVNT